MNNIKSRTSSKSKLSEVSSKKKINIKPDVYDEWRPPAGIRYQLSQTEAHLDAFIPRVHLKYTTVEYEPGQDLTVAPTADTSKYSEKYIRRKSRGPVWKFLEEIQEEKRIKIQQKFVANNRAQRKKRDKIHKEAVKGIHDMLMHRIGPSWFHELSPKQMQSADELKDAMLKDHKLQTIANTQETLTGMGLVLWPNHTKIQYALKKFYLCPVEFLMTLVTMNRSKDSNQNTEYTLNDKIMLSSIVHLTMREILRELHLRIPSPPRMEKKKVKKQKSNETLKEMLRKARKYNSPYMIPQILIKQKRRHGIYKNRHKEYPWIEYFDYVDDMYNVHYEDDPDSVVQRKETKNYKLSKYCAPPSIPVRYIISKMKKKKVYELKKPSPYVSACKTTVKTIEVKEKEYPTEEVTETHTTTSNVCSCTPVVVNKTADNDEKLVLCQTLCPYNTEQKKQPCSNPDSTQRTDYSCNCNKIINVFPENKVNKQLSEILEEQEIDLEQYEEYEMQPEDTMEDDKICKCESIRESKHSIFSNLDDPYWFCTCKSSSESLCSCCICDQIDKDFLLNIKRYNEINKTNLQPCRCSCNCKKNKKSRCHKPKYSPCKYCFCNKIKKVVEEVEEEETKIIESEPKEEPKLLPFVNKEEQATNEEVEGEEAEEEPCICDHLFTTFVQAHDSCMSLFNQFKTKIEHDMEEYLDDLRDNRCTCGDTDSSSSSSIKEEFEESDDCLCNIPDFSGCTCNCNQTEVDKILDCTCGSSEKSEISHQQKGSCKCADFINQMKEPLESTDVETNITDETSLDPSKVTETVKSKKSDETVTKQSNTIENDESSMSVDEEEEKEEEKKSEEIDPRIFVLEKFPKDKKEQMDLLKEALRALAEDGYPLAKLPDCHRLPHFQLWLDKRSGKYISMKERGEYYKNSKLSWNHIEICRRQIDAPDFGLSTAKMRKMTWGAVNTYKNLINSVKYDYQRKVKQAYIDQAQEMFPSMFHYQFPTKMFRHCYFAYLPADENHCFAIKPWEPHEYNDMTQHQSCL